MSMNTEKTSNRQLCQATRTDGSPCKAWAALNGLCVGHQPGAGEARRQGGLNRSTKARADKKLPLRIRTIVILLEKGLIEVYRGELQTGRAQAMASLGNAIVKAYESGILEERLTILERKIGGTGDGAK